MANQKIIQTWGKDMRVVALERQYLENEIAIIQREQIDPLQDQIDLRQHENELLQRQVDKVNEAYDQQFAALDAIAAKEQQISGLKQGQLSLADALSKGDIAAAARARNDYMSQFAQYATESTRKALEAQRDAATYQARERIRLNDEAIWNLNQQIYDIQNGPQMQALQAQLELLDEIEQTYTRTLTDADAIARLVATSPASNPLEDYWNKVAAAATAARDAAIAAVGATPGATPSAPPATTETPGATPPPAAPPANITLWDLFLSSFRALGDNDKEWVKKKIFRDRDRGDNFATWRNVWENLSGDQKRKAINVMQQGISSQERKDWTPFKYGGSVPGIGNVDSFKALLTPGEFVVNKAASAQFRSVLESINASGGPRFNVPANAAAGINAGVYNNNASYVINVAVNGTNASGEDIAQAIMNRIQQTENMKIRSYRY